MSQNDLYIGYTKTFAIDCKSYRMLSRNRSEIVFSISTVEIDKSYKRNDAMQTYRRANRGVKSERLGASVKGKKFEHFARFEARSERKALRAAGHLHSPLLSRTIKANRIQDHPCCCCAFNLYTCRVFEGPARNNWTGSFLSSRNKTARNCSVPSCSIRHVEYYIHHFINSLLYNILLSSFARFNFERDNEPYFIINQA